MAIHLEYKPWLHIGVYGSPRARWLATRRAIKSDDVILADSAGECQCGEKDDIARARNDIERGCAFAMAATSGLKNKI